MLGAVLLALPVLKVAWTLGGGSAATDALSVMGPGNWADVVVGMFLGEPLLALVLAVVTARASYAYFAAAGRAVRRHGVPLWVSAVTAAITPVAFGVVMGALHGWTWGLVTALVAYVLRVGVMVDYATGHRSRPRGGPAVTGVQRAAVVVGCTGLVLAVVVLPALAVVAALDGRSWTSVVICEVNTGGGPYRARLIELGRQGDGVVGWDVATSQAVNGAKCAADDNDAVRPAWWRT